MADGRGTDEVRQQLLKIVRRWVCLAGRDLLAQVPDKRALINALYALLDDAHTDAHGRAEALSILQEPQP